MGNFNLNQKVSSQLAFILVMLLSFLTAWYSVSAGQKIIENARESETFGVNKSLASDKEAKNKK